MGKRIVFRKLKDPQLSAFLSCENCMRLTPGAFEHPRDVPEDIYPQVVIDVRSVMACDSSRFVRVRNHVKYFTRRYEPSACDLSGALADDVRELTQTWHRAYQGRMTAMAKQVGSNISVDDDAYRIFVTAFSDRIDRHEYFSKVIYVDRKAAGFIFAGKTAPEAAALYSSLSLTEYHGSSEYLLLQLLPDLNCAGIKWLNLGGAETEGLFKFKAKFGAKSLRPSYDVEVI